MRGHCHAGITKITATAVSREAESRGRGNRIDLFVNRGDLADGVASSVGESNGPEIDIA
jgi:hypothetical protein